MKNETALSRTCFNCKVTWPLTAHHFYRSNSRYFQRECKGCNKKRRAIWWKGQGGKLSNANTKLKARFGITLDQYNRLVAEQENKCWICGSHHSWNGHRLAVDHDHKSGRIRGLLCKACNVGLGNFQDRPELLERAAQYLKEKQNGKTSVKYGVKEQSYCASSR